MWVHKYYRGISYALILLIISFSSAVTYLLVEIKSINSFSFFDNNYNRFLTHRPWFRMPSYFMGMLLGLIISRLHCARYEVEINPFKQALLQIFGLLFGFVSVFGLVFNFA